MKRFDSLIQKYIEAENADKALREESDRVLKPLLTECSTYDESEALKDEFRERLSELRHDGDPWCVDGQIHVTFALSGSRFIESENQ
jgi:hypothetical protein